jgi:hypothetical protein
MREEPIDLTSDPVVIDKWKPGDVMPDWEKCG